MLKLDFHSSPIRAYRLQLGYNKSLDINKFYILLWHVELNTSNVLTDIIIFQQISSVITFRFVVFNNINRFSIGKRNPLQ